LATRGVANLYTPLALQLAIVGLNPEFTNTSPALKSVEAFLK
jgi:hypothetical protein